MILPEISPETSEQKFCTNVASEQKKIPAKSSGNCYGANPQSNCSKKFLLIMQKYRPKIATKIFYCSIVEKNSGEVLHIAKGTVPW
jgi:hypothetical protein